MLRVGPVAQQENDYIFVPDTVLHSQERGTVGVDLGIIDGDNSTIWKCVIRAYFTQWPREHCLDSPAYLLAPLSAPLFGGMRHVGIKLNVGHGGMGVSKGYVASGHEATV